MKNYTLETSNGLRDYKGDEVIIKEKIEYKLKKLLESFSYELIYTPTFEYIDVYQFNGLQNPSLYNLVNREGELLALRNDMTASVARVVASSNDVVMPKRYCYIDNTFRYPRLYQGKSHEFRQAGAELIGQGGINGDCEILRLVIKSMEQTGISDYKIHIGNSEFLKMYFDNIGIKTPYEVIDCLSRHDFVGIKKLEKKFNVKDEYISLTDMILMYNGKLEFIDKLIDLTSNLSCQNILLDLKELYLYMNDKGLASNMIFDLAIVEYQEYYSGFAFKVYSSDIFTEVISGGRYDDYYLKKYNIPLKAIGFGLNVEAVVKYCLNKNLEVNKEIYLSISDDISFGYANQHNDSLRDKGIIVEECYINDILKAKEYAYAKGIKKLLKYENNKLEVIEV